MKLKQYEDEVLKTWRTGRLGALYITSYLVSRDHSEESSQLERIAQILSTRPLAERESLLLHLKTEIRVAQKLRDFERGRSYAQMMGHYIESVLQPNPNSENRSSGQS
ncbi:MAG TPA: hypothetical protein VJG31_02160 [Candidatus Nanoarchaeia archaeon]|nr:hypothetical protein [Candidatus Nanoarchaeia archaeon]